MERDDVVEGRHRHVQDLSDAQAVRNVRVLAHGAGETTNLFDNLFNCAKISKFYFNF